jgi:hypothetical protein
MKNTYFHKKVFHDEICNHEDVIVIQTESSIFKWCKTCGVLIEETPLRYPIITRDPYIKEKEDDTTDKTIPYFMKPLFIKTYTDFNSN